jgi:hypothetical protein
MMSLMLRKTLLTAAILALAGSVASAQDARVELSGTAGWTFSDGVTGDNVTVPGLGVFDAVDPKDAFSWGLRLGYMVTENVEVGFLFDQQATELEISGTSTVTLADVNINNYHGYFAYNFGYGDAKARPYVLIGLGATQYGSVNVVAAGVDRDIDGNTKFSGTGALGVKVFPSPRFGIRLEARWTPTYIKSDAAGWWCDPYWGCWVVGDAQYSNQFELSGGVTLRF